MIIETTTTKARGRAITGAPLDMEMTLIICMNVMIKKYRLAIFFVNYSNRLIGRKLYHVYFDVRTVLLLMWRF